MISQKKLRKCALIRFSNEFHLKFPRFFPLFNFSTQKYFIIDFHLHTKKKFELIVFDQFSHF